MAALGKDKIVAVIGAGTMGSGIAQVAAQAGHTVKLFDAFAAAVPKGIAGVGAGLDRVVERGRMSKEARDGVMARIVPASSLNELSDASLVIEAVLEKLDVKRALFGELEKILAPDAILATNTSSLSITEIAAPLQRPERVVGMHFFNPAPVMALVEVITGLATDPAVASAIFETSRAWGKNPVVATSTPGFIANRIARPFYSESLKLLHERAADVATLDAVLRDCGGFRMGAFELMDLIGNDVNATVTRSVWEAFHYDSRYTPSLLQQELVAAGRFGRKAGRGWYDHAKDAAKPTVATLPACAKPGRARVFGYGSEANAVAAFFDPLLGLAKNKGVELAVAENFARHNGIAIALDAATLVLGDGRPADSIADVGGNPVVTFDLALDYAVAPRIAIAAAAGAPAGAIAAAAGFFQALGKQVTQVADVPGLVLMRVVAMLANEAADAVYQGVCDAASADTATVKGLNYPAGPLAWAGTVGPARIAQVLGNLQRHYGDARYRTSPIMARPALWKHHVG
ncbi:MAG: 3-hydroxyacyl-CoA dehydrogenase [Alphaproteobacteria bacterium]